MNKEVIIERQANENLKLVNDTKDLQQRIDELKEICKEYKKYKDKWFEEECKDALDDISNIVLRGEE